MRATRTEWTRTLPGDEILPNPIGSITDAPGLLRREAGTLVTLDARGLELVHAA